MQILAVLNVFDPSLCHQPVLRCDSQLVGQTAHKNALIQLYKFISRHFCQALSLQTAAVTAVREAVDDNNRVTNCLSVSLSVRPSVCNV